MPNSKQGKKCIHIANIKSLICLKGKALLDLMQRMINGEMIDSKHIAKHKKDVFRLAAMLSPTSRYKLPETLRKDVQEFCEIVMQELPNADFIKSTNLVNVTGLLLVEQLRKSML